MTIIKANKTQKSGTHDKVMTPEKIAKMIIDWLPLQKSDIILDPCKGTGSFYNNYPENTIKHYCEIDEGIDFFNFNFDVDWIITNPPYSIFDEFLKHSFEIADNVVFLCPLSKIVSSMGRVRQYKKYGGVPKILIISASKCGFPFGFPCCAVWFKKDYNGLTKIEVDNY